MAHSQTDSGIKPDPIHRKVLNSEFKNSHYEFYFREELICYLLMSEPAPNISIGKPALSQVFSIMSPYVSVHIFQNFCLWIAHFSATQKPGTLILGQDCQSPAVWERLTSHEVKALEEGCRNTGPVAGIHTQFSHFQHRYGVPNNPLLRFCEKKWNHNSKFTVTTLHTFIL